MANTIKARSLGNKSGVKKPKDEAKPLKHWEIGVCILLGLLGLYMYYNSTMNSRYGA